jgi:hypothetical protein
LDNFLSLCYAGKLYAINCVSLNLKACFATS